MTTGSYNFFKPEALVSGSQNRFSYMLLGSYLDTDGYRHNNALLSKDLLGNFGFDVSDHLKVKLSTGLHDDSYGQPGSLYLGDLRAGIVDQKDSTHPNDTASTNDNFFDLVPEILLREDIVLSLGASYRDRHTGSYYDYGFGSYYDSKSELQTYAFTPKIEVSTPIAGLKNIFVVGADYDRYPTTVSSSGLLPGPSQSTSDINKRDFAGYADEKIFPFQDLALEAGYRRQKSSFDVDYKDFINPVLSETGTNSYDRDAYRLSANYSILKKANVFASYSEGFRFPTTDEFVVYGYSPAPGIYVPTTLNTALKPQTTREFDFGVRWDPWHGVGGSVTYFQSRNRDEITSTRFDQANENYDKTIGRAWNRAFSSTSHGSYAQPDLFLYRSPLRWREFRKPHTPRARKQGIGKAFLCHLQLEFQPRLRVHGRALRHKRPGERAGAVARLHDLRRYRRLPLGQAERAARGQKPYEQEVQRDRGVQPLCQRYRLVPIAGSRAFPHPEIRLWKVDTEGSHSSSGWTESCLLSRSLSTPTSRRSILPDSGNKKERVLSRVNS